MMMIALFLAAFSLYFIPGAQAFSALRRVIVKTPMIVPTDFKSLSSRSFQINLSEKGPTEPIPGTIEEEKSDDGKIMVFGLNLKDPQDIITIFLGSVIVVNTLDIALFWVKKLFGGSE